MNAELGRVESQQQMQHLLVPPEVIEHMLAEMRDMLEGTDTRAKRGLLKKIVAWVELGKDKGNVYATFPLLVRVYIQYPRGDSNARARLRRPPLYPLSYGG